MTNDPLLEHLIVSTKASLTQRVKNAFVKHRTSIVLGTALAASLVAHALRPPMRLGDAQLYYLTHDDVTYLNGLLEADQTNQTE